MPVHSPMMCTAIYMKKYMQVTDEIAFISPCIAKKLEITDPNCGGYVSYNVTFEKMMKGVNHIPMNWNTDWVLCIRCLVDCGRM